MVRWSMPCAAPRFPTCSLLVVRLVSCFYRVDCCLSLAFSPMRCRGLGVASCGACGVRRSVWSCVRV